MRTSNGRRRISALRSTEATLARADTHRGEFTESFAMVNSFGVARPVTARGGAYRDVISAAGRSAPLATPCTGPAGCPTRLETDVPALRSRITTHGRNMAGARALLARHRHARRRLRQADRRDGQLLHPVRARPRAPQGPRRARRRRGPRGRRRAARVQHDRRRRRHRDGPRRDALLAAVARADRRRGRVHGQRALRRRAGLHLELRQDHAGDAHGRAAAQHPDGLRLRRADGGRQGGRRGRPVPSGST